MKYSARCVWETGHSWQSPGVWLCWLSQLCQKEIQWTSRRWEMELVMEMEMEMEMDCSRECCFHFLILIFEFLILLFWIEDADALCLNVTLPHNSTCSWHGYEELEVKLKFVNFFTDFSDFYISDFRFQKSFQEIKIYFE